MRRSLRAATMASATASAAAEDAADGDFGDDEPAGVSQQGSGLMSALGGPSGQIEKKNKAPPEE